MPANSFAALIFIIVVSCAQAGQAVHVERVAQVAWANTAAEQPPALKLLPLTLKSKGKTLHFVVLEVNPAKLSLHWKDDKGQAFHTFTRLQQTLEKDKPGTDIVAMMNAGIFTREMTPAGLYIENGRLLKPINQRRGKGNFHLQPNGVFLVTNKQQPRVLTTQQYVKQYGLEKRQSNIRLATQSGPMLVINGKVNGKFSPDSQLLHRRNGVCVSTAGDLFFIATDDDYATTVSLYQFAQAAKSIGCRNALYLDGSISKLYVKGKNTRFHFPYFVGILAVAQ